MQELTHGVNLERRGEWAIIHIDYWADPRKRDPEWAVRMRARLGEQRFRREILRDWTVAAGEPYFLEVANDPMGYVYEVPYLMDAPVYVGLDFGRRHPAACWMQYDKKADRVFVLREWMPAMIGADTFRDCVLWLSGLRAYGQLAPHAQVWADRLTRDPSFPQTPFFPPRVSGGEFVWWAGHEANMERAEVAAESEERSTADIWRAAGINLGVYAVAVALTGTGDPKASRRAGRRLACVAVQSNMPAADHRLCGRHHVREGHSCKSSPRPCGPRRFLRAHPRRARLRRRQRIGLPWATGCARRARACPSAA